MTLSALLIALENVLKPLVESAKGDFHVSDTEYDALETLGQAPDRWRVLMCPGGCDSGDSGDDIGGYVSESIQFFIQSPTGMANDSAKGLHRTKPNQGPSYLARKEWLIREVRGLQIEHEEIDMECGRVFRFVGWDWVRVEGVPWRASRVRFQVRYILTDTDGPDPLPAIVLNGIGYVPPGGEVGDVLIKTGPGNYAVAWQTPPVTPGLEIVGEYLHVTLDGITKRFR
ncbi:MAG TPA: hypothetical protein VGE39_00675, partial [Prosthecobacter sp.]